MKYRKIQSEYAKRGFNVSYVRGKGYYVTHKDIKHTYKTKDGSVGFTYLRVFYKEGLENIEQTIQSFWDYLPSEIDTPTCPACNYDPITGTKPGLEGIPKSE